MASGKKYIIKSDYCSKNLLNFLDNRLGQTKNQKMSETERVYDALTYAFKQCEDYVVKAADLAYPLGLNILKQVLEDQQEQVLAHQFVLL